MPKVTVALPSYNHEKYIARSIESVLDQTYQDFEIVITDDASKDGTRNIINKYHDPRIRYYLFPENQGACAAFNNCICESKGEYIAMLHSDDLFSPEKLEKQVSFLDHHSDVAAIFNYAELIDEEGKKFTDIKHPYYNIFRQPNRTRYQWLNHFFYKANALCHPSVMIRKSCFEQIGYYNECYAQVADLDFWIRLCMKHEIYVIPENLTKFRIRASEINASGNRPEAQRRVVAEFTRILNNFIKIKSADELFGIFPELKRKYQSCFDESLIPFYISMLALEQKTIMHQNFSIFTLYDLLSNPDIQKKLRDMCGFTMPEFTKLTGKYDLYNIGSGNIVDYKNIVQEKNV